MQRVSQMYQAKVLRRVGGNTTERGTIIDETKMGR